MIAQVRKILFINPFGIGDVLFTTPLVNQARKVFCGAKIGFVCNRRVHPILRSNSDIARIWVLERDEFRRLWRQSKMGFLTQAWGLYRQIRDQHFDLAFDLSLSDQFGFFLWAMGVPRRVGFRYRGRGRFLNAWLALKEGYKAKHVAEYQLDLLRLVTDQSGDDIPSLRYELSADARTAAVEKMRQAGLDGSQALVGIAPGGGDSWGPNAPMKRWSPGHFSGLCRMLIGEGFTPVFLGNAQDQPVIEEICQNLPAPIASVAGKCSLEESAAVLSRCALVVANDGGLLHLAVAQDIPTVSFFGPTDDKVYGPFPPSERHLVLSHALPCRPCYQNLRMPPCPYNKKCLEELTPQEAFEKIKDAFLKQVRQ